MNASSAPGRRPRAGTGRSRRFLRGRRPDGRGFRAGHRPDDREPCTGRWPDGRRSRTRRRPDGQGIRTGRWANDRGDASIETAIILPVVILLTTVIVQACLAYYAKQVVLTAAREGVQAATAYRSTDAAGAARARAVLTRVAGDSLLAPGISTAGSTGERATVTVTGRAPSVLPGFGGITVTQSASAPRERWTVKP